MFKELIYEEVTAIVGINIINLKLLMIMLKLLHEEHANLLLLNSCPKSLLILSRVGLLESVKCSPQRWHFPVSGLL